MTESGALRPRTVFELHKKMFLVGLQVNACHSVTDSDNTMHNSWITGLWRQRLDLLLALKYDATVRCIKETCPVTS